MPSIDDIYGSPWMRASDVPSSGITGTIVECGTERLSPKGQREQTKLSIRLNSHPKPCLVNVTNAKLLAAAYGKDYTQWPGHHVQITVQEVMYGGDLVDGLKISPAQEV